MPRRTLLPRPLIGVPAGLTVLTPTQGSQRSLPGIIAYANASCAFVRVGIASLLFWRRTRAVWREIPLVRMNERNAAKVT